MLFNSHIFLFVFLPIVLLVWWRVLRGDRPRLLFLTLASYVFYAAFQFPRGLWLLPLLVASTSADYVAGRRIAASDVPSVRRAWLVAALAVNLGLLFTFKYLGFFEEALNGGFDLLGIGASVPVAHLLLPIGISFYTFNSMSYTIDIYRRRVEPDRSVVHYSAFVALFPHLVAGPIVRYEQLEEQLRHLARRLDPGMASLGIYFLVCGLAKKLLVADQLAPTVDRLHASVDQLGAVAAWCAALGYAMQLYFDFSGYSDMAVGLALLLGFRFPQNFASPYKARSVLEFWDRWHITLSHWMRDYLYVSLGGSRGTALRVARNLVLTFLLVGLWHGAAWTFVAWGLYHGVWVAVARIARNRGWSAGGLVLGRLTTFLGVVFSMVLFRAVDLGAAGSMFAALAGANGLGASHALASGHATDVGAAFVAGLVAVLAFVQLAPNSWEYGERFRATRRSAVVLGIVFVACVLLLSKPSPFLYFQF